MNAKRKRNKETKFQDQYATPKKTQNFFFRLERMTGNRSTSREGRAPLASAEQSKQNLSTSAATRARAPHASVNRRPTVQSQSVFSRTTIHMCITISVRAATPVGCSPEGPLAFRLAGERKEGRGPAAPGTPGLARARGTRGQEQRGMLLDGEGLFEVAH